MGSTTKICIYNKLSNEVIIVANKEELSKYLHVNYETIVNWFRNNNNVVNYKDYLILKADSYIKKNTVSFNPKKNTSS